MININSKYAIIIGTTAEAIKTIPIMQEFQKRNIEYTFIHTGQHNLGTLCKKCKIKEPDIVINARNGFKGNTGGAFSWGLQTLPKIVSYLKEKKDIVKKLYLIKIMTSNKSLKSN